MNFKTQERERQTEIERERQKEKKDEKKSEGKREILSLVVCNGASMAMTGVT